MLSAAGGLDTAGAGGPKEKAGVEEVLEGAAKGLADGPGAGAPPPPRPLRLGRPRML